LIENNTVPSKSGLFYAAAGGVLGRAG